MALIPAQNKKEKRENMSAKKETTAKKSTKKTKKAAEVAVEANVEVANEPVVEETALATTEDKSMSTPASYGDYEDDGFDDDAEKERIIPMLRLLQQMSPDCKPVGKGGTEGAEPGLMINTATNEIYTSLNLAMAHTEKIYIEWEDRKLQTNEGNGFVAVHYPDSEFVKSLQAEQDKERKETGGPWKPLMNGTNTLSETRVAYCAVLDDDLVPTGEFLVVNFTSTKIKKYKQYVSSVHSYLHRMESGRKRKVPLFFHTFTLTSEEQKHAGGDSYNYKLTPTRGKIKDSLLAPGSAEAQDVIDLRDNVLRGQRRADQATGESGGRSGGGGEENLDDGTSPF